MFLVIAATMEVAATKGWRVLTDDRGLQRVFVLGYLLYATAAALSVPLQLLGIYDRVGAAILTGPLGGLITPLPEPVWGWSVDNTGLAFMDFAIEESIELLAAALLLTGISRAHELVDGSSAQLVRTPPAEGTGAERIG